VQITAAGGKALPIALDVGDVASVKAAFAEIETGFGRLDILINNAGIYPMAAFEELSDATWDAVFSVNLRGVSCNCWRSIFRNGKTSMSEKSRHSQEILDAVSSIAQASSSTSRIAASASSPMPSTSFRYPEIEP
jgi:NAD(P)-dependent dehydrogenase (short-subunit alcohol dehydrogenase family)